MPTAHRFRHVISREKLVSRTKKQPGKSLPAGHWCRGSACSVMFSPSFVLFESINNLFDLFAQQMSYQHVSACSVQAGGRV